MISVMMMMFSMETVSRWTISPISLNPNVAVFPEEPISGRPGIASPGAGRDDFNDVSRGRLGSRNNNYRRPYNGHRQTNSDTKTDPCLGGGSGKANNSGKSNDFRFHRSISGCFGVEPGKIPWFRLPGSL